MDHHSINNDRWRVTVRISLTLKANIIGLICPCFLTSRQLILPFNLTSGAFYYLCIENSSDHEAGSNLTFMTNPPVHFHPQKGVYIINMDSKMWWYVSFKSFLHRNNSTTHISVAANECLCLCVLFSNRSAASTSLWRCHQTAFNPLYTESHRIGYA